jgi:hypothetical protein
MVIPFLILSPLAMMWLLALWHHPPARRQVRVVWHIFLHALTKPVGKQRDAFAHFFAGIAIASGVGATSVAFETHPELTAWTWYLKLAALIVVLIVALSLASLCYIRHHPRRHQGDKHGVRYPRHGGLVRRPDRLRLVRRHQHHQG